MKQPQFIKEFSKQESQEERDTLAQDIRQKRAEVFDSKKVKNEELKNKKQETQENQEALTETLNQITELQNKIETISSTLPSKILNLVEYLKIKSRLKNRAENADMFQSKQDTLSQEGFDIQEELRSLDLSSSMKDAKEAIARFYTKQQEKWANTEYSKEDIKTYFSPEHLSGLSTEEYVLLLKRFPNHMVTHVTRQGIRDHVGAVNHHAGINKLWNGFKDIAEAGGLKSSFDIHVTENTKDEELIGFLNLKQKTKEEAARDIEYLAGEDTQHHHGSMADRMSLHVATEEVANTHYGAETRNEIFFAYPSALIASQYLFAGQLTKADGGYHNNQWIFVDKDLDINSGFVFIPKDVQVDRVHGSKYQLNENLEPIQNVELQNKIATLVTQENFITFIQKYEQLLGSVGFDVEELFEGEPRSVKDQEVKRTFTEARTVLSDIFGVADVAIQKLILNYDFIRKITHGDQIEIVKAIQNRMNECGIAFVLAQDSVSSQEYWENYFAQHSDKKPNKIVYYEDDDPTYALQKWKQEHGLDKTTSDTSLGFAENSINLSDSNQVQTKVPRVSRFKNLANKIINEFYI